MTSRQTVVAVHSEMRPWDRAARVFGRSATRVRASPRCREPRAGDSLRASAISAATPRPRSFGGMSSCASAAHRSSNRAAASRAWAAAQAALSSSRTRIRSTASTWSSAVSHRSSRPIRLASSPRLGSSPVGGPGTPDTAAAASPVG